MLWYIFLIMKTWGFLTTGEPPKSSKNQPNFSTETHGDLGYTNSFPETSDQYSQIIHLSICVVKHIHPFWG
jgi:hypothetical protein